MYTSLESLGENAHFQYDNNFPCQKIFLLHPIEKISFFRLQSSQTSH